MKGRVQENMLCLLSVVQWHEQGRNALLPFLVPCNLWQAGDGRKVMRVEELAMSVTSYNTQKSGPCSSPGSRAALALVVQMADEPAPRL